MDIEAADRIADDMRVPRKAAWSILLLLGAADLLANLACEGARSSIGPYLETLGATGFIVGSVAGLGQCLRLVLRPVTSRLLERGRFHRPITIAGYVVQMLAVPLISQTGSWPNTAACVVLERIGQGIRSAPRAALPARASEAAFDGAFAKLGAFMGPVAVGILLAWQRDFRFAFASLAVPAAGAILLAAGARLRSPEAATVEPPKKLAGRARYPRACWLYCGSASLFAFGMADFPLIAYHLSKAHIVSHPRIAVFYAVALGAGGLGSLPIGRLLDRAGMTVLVPITVAVAAYGPLAFLGGYDLALIGTLLWGIGLGAHDTATRVVLAKTVPHERLASAQNLFRIALGFAWLAGGAVLGAVYDVSVAGAAWLAVVALLLAAIPLWVGSRRAWIPVAARSVEG